jgi:hypothetical protein
VRPTLLLLVTLAALACRREPLHDYPADVVDNFLAACRVRGGSDDACRCSLDALRHRFPAGEYAALEQRVAAGDPGATKLLAEVAGACVGR